VTSGPLMRVDLLPEAGWWGVRAWGDDGGRAPCLLSDRAHRTQHGARAAVALARLDYSLGGRLYADSGAG
jgi:hypothetical protein